MSKTKLIISEQQQIEKTTIGLVTSESIYQLVWKLNSHLGIQLKEKSIIRIKNIPEIPSFFHADEINSKTYILTTNKINQKTVLRKDYSGIDFLLIVTGMQNRNEQNNFIIQLKELKIFTLVATIDNKDINHFEFLL